MPKTHLKKRKATELSPRLQELEQLLDSGPKTVGDLAKAMGLEGPRSIANVRSYLSKLAAVRPVIVNFAYRSSTYELDKKNLHDSQEIS